MPSTKPTHNTHTQHRHCSHTNPPTHTQQSTQPKHNDNIYHIHTLLKTGRYTRIQSTTQLQYTVTKMNNHDINIFSNRQTYTKDTQLPKHHHRTHYKNKFQTTTQPKRYEVTSQLKACKGGLSSGLCRGRSQGGGAVGGDLWQEPT